MNIETEKGKLFALCLEKTANDFEQAKTLYGQIKGKSKAWLELVSQGLAAGASQANAVAFANAEATK